MDWLGKSSKVEGKNELENLGIRFEPILFHPDLNEYELRIQIPGCPRNLIKLTYDKASGQLKLQGKKQKTEFVHQFPVPDDCLATGIYGRFRGDVLHIIMPRLLSEWPASEAAPSKQEDDRKSSSDQPPTKQVEENREKLPARVPEPSPSVQKSTDKSTEGGKSRDKLPARVTEPSPSDQKSTGRLTEGGGKDREKLPAKVLSLPPPSDQEMTEKLRQRDNELFPEISAPRPVVRELGGSVKELRENYQKKISKIAAPPPPPPPPTPRAAAPAPWNRITTKIGSRKEEEEDREPSSDQNKAKQGDVELEKSVVKSQNKEGELGQEVAKNMKIAMAEQGDDESEKSVVKSPKKESKSGQEVAKNAKIVTESKDKEESKEEKPSAGGKETLGLVAKVKETGKAAVAAAMKEENRPVVMIGAAVLALLVIGASLRSSSKKIKN
ncbi:ABC transporter F family member 4-like [Benincasa hispida]|uniref:ABC transporter F family member 4-like n=1 Tax=Benincasa hispida TaxID=102211 RepID=UPI0018FFD828|nr:ABC transporter F family member 4-like [Benincasa hispida]